ncbi:hypothetical protein RIR_jg21672.t1 [Rhizophagus irregularis DAOM 181602=DAOM 197198]|nr:hypothetical protein RIR_jg21672.t1 [Rhizophagus irregularis DAOM 181602=DAOM 197198]
MCSPSRAYERSFSDVLCGWSKKYWCTWDNATQNLHYPSNKKLDKLNIVHLFHDDEFKSVRMSTQFVSLLNWLYNYR